MQRSPSVLRQNWFFCRIAVLVWMGEKIKNLLGFDDASYSGHGKEFRSCRQRIVLPLITAVRHRQHDCSLTHVESSLQVECLSIQRWKMDDILGLIQDRWC